MLEILNIKKSFQQPVLIDITFTVEKGDCVCILGQNGCGKSTLIEIIAGAMKADAGDILLDQLSLFQNKKLFSKNIGYVPQENPIIEELTVKDNLSLWYCLSDRDLNADLEQGQLARLGMKEIINKKAGILSGGMKKRLSIACALAGNAPILLLDEPSAALDFVCKSEIHEYLMQYREKGGTVIMTTHEESELRLCNQLYVMREGCLHKIPHTVIGDELIQIIKGRD